MAKFKALRIFSEEGKVQARMADLELDELDPGEVVVRTAWSSVNFKDALAATGTGKIVRRFPCVGGIDGCGTVVSSSDARFKVGDSVICTSYDIGVSHDGGYAEFMRVPAAWVVPLPRGMSLYESMALGTAGYTAGLAVVRMEREGLKPANGPVIVPFTKTGDATFTAPAGAQLTEAQYSAYKAGNLYVNVHSVKYPDGEVRAQIAGR